MQSITPNYAVVKFLFWFYVQVKFLSQDPCFSMYIANYVFLTGNKRNRKNAFVLADDKHAPLYSNQIMRKNDEYYKKIMEWSTNNYRANYYSK